MTYADKLVEGGRKVPIEQAIKKLASELGESHPSIERMRELHKEFSQLIGDWDADRDIS